MTTTTTADRVCPLCCRRVQPEPGGQLPGHYSMGPGIGGWCPGPGPVTYDHFCRECGGQVAPNVESGLTSSHYRMDTTEQRHCKGSSCLGDLVPRAPAEHAA